jgi:hypothetical protein
VHACLGAEDFSSTRSYVKANWPEAVRAHVLTCKCACVKTCLRESVLACGRASLKACLRAGDLVCKRPSVYA